MVKRWKEIYIQDYGNIKVSDHGDVLSKDNKILNKKIDSSGYYYYRFHFNNYRNLQKSGKTYMAQIKEHRLVAQCFVENDEGFLEVNHIDGNKKNNKYDNLEWCSRSHNVKHSYDFGLKLPSKREKNGRALLNSFKVDEIRKLYSEGFSIAEIARKFSVGWTTISHIIKKETWN